MKTMCAVLACTTIMSSMLAAYATEEIVSEPPISDGGGVNWTADEGSLEGFHSFRYGRRIRL